MRREASSKEAEGVQTVGSGLGSYCALRRVPSSQDAGSSSLEVNREVPDSMIGHSISDVTAKMKRLDQWHMHE